MPATYLYGNVTQGVSIPGQDAFDSDLDFPEGSLLSSLGQITGALDASVLPQLGDHNDGWRALGQHHGPEVLQSVSQRTLRGYVGSLLGVVSLRTTAQTRLTNVKCDTTVL